MVREPRRGRALEGHDDRRKHNAAGDQDVEHVLQAVVRHDDQPVNALGRHVRRARKAVCLARGAGHVLQEALGGFLDELLGSVQAVAAKWRPLGGRSERRRRRLRSSRCLLHDGPDGGAPTSLSPHSPRKTGGQLGHGILLRQLANGRRWPLASGGRPLGRQGRRGNLRRRRHADGAPASGAPVFVQPASKHDKVQPILFGPTQPARATVRPSTL